MTGYQKLGRTSGGLALLTMMTSALALPSAASAAEKTELTFLMWQDPQAGPIWKSIVDGFEAEHPDITVTLILNPDDYQTKAKLMMDSGLLDLAMIDYIFFPTWALAGYLTPLDPYIASDNFDTSSYWPASLAAVRYHGQLQGLPMDVNDQAMFYNPRLFDDAGVSYPDATWTWTDFRDAVKKLVKTNASGVASQYGFGTTVYWEPLMSWIWNNGGDYVNTERNRLTLDQPAAAETIAMFADMVHTQQMSKDMWNAPDLFVNQQLGMYGMGYWEISRMRGTPGLDWAVAPLPYRLERDGKPYRNSTLGGVSIGIPASSKHKEAAWEFIKYRLRTKVQLEASSLGLSMPSSRDAAQALRNTLAGDPHHVGVFLDALAYTHPFPTFPNFSDIDDNVISPALEQIWNGAVSAKQGLETAVQKANGMLQGQSPYTP